MIKIDKAAFDKVISIQNKGKSKIYVYQSERYIDNNPVKVGTTSNLGINIDHYNATRKQAGTSGIQLGDDIVINVRVTNPSALAINDLALNVKMPAGWELINPRLYETEVIKNKGNYTYQDYKDDRVYTFFDMQAGGSVSYAFKAKAAFTGDFFMPAVSCEHMYNGSIYARTGTSRVVIGK